jgi:hypothetical protein
MAIVLNGTTGITNDGGYTGDGVSFADTTPANTLVTTTGGNVGIGNNSPDRPVHLKSSGTRNYIKAETTTSSNSNEAGFQITTPSSNFLINSLGATNALLVYDLNAGAERMRITSDGLFQFNSGYGSVATAYGCRAWVNFNGTGTVSIRGSGNVSSITDNGAGNYNVNFTTAMPNVNYAITSATQAATTNLFSSFVDSFAVGSFRIVTVNASNVTTDTPTICCSVFR